MLLGRLRVRQKLALLVLPLLVLVIIGAVPVVTARISAAGDSARSADAIRRAVRIGELVQELQQERLASLGYLAELERRDRVVARSAQVLDLAEQLSADYAGGDEQLATALRGVGDGSQLDRTRAALLAGTATGIAVYTGYTDAVAALIGELRLGDGIDLGADSGRKQLALDSIIRHGEAAAAAGAALFVEPGRRITPRVIALVSAGRAVEDREERVFVPLADPAAVELYRDVAGGQSSRTVSDYFDKISQLELTAPSVPPELLPKVESLISLARLVETRAAAQAVESTARSARRDNWLAGLGTALALLVVVGAGLLSILVARSIARPLGRLTASADEVADAAQQELVRVADTEDPQAAAPRLRPVQVGTSDELGELAKAFNRVQQVAADLVERQVVSRRNVATMFGNVGRRTQNLVGRQLAMIDSLERNEQDPVLLDRLYRLDHVSTRLRRNANSLVVLSGAVDPDMTGEPLSLADTIRSALGEIEGFQRVRIGAVEPVLLSPHVTPDVILLLAELLENGTSFSPPNTEVEVGAVPVGTGDVLIRIVDRGLGMTPEQLAAENARLVERERLDMAPTDVLGLFVVGRLARRHGIQVTLAPTPGSGVTAEVMLPARVVMGAPAPAPEAVPAGAALGGAAPAVLPGPGTAGAPEPPGAPGATRSPGAQGAPGAREERARDWWEPVAPAAAPDVRSPGVGSPGVGSPGVGSPGVGSPGVGSPGVGSPGIGSPEVGSAEAPEDSVVRPFPIVPPPGGIRRRVRGAQLPDTGPPAEGPPAGQPRAAAQPADEARRSIEDFEDGVRRAQQESAAEREAGGPARNGRPQAMPGTRAVPLLPSSAPLAPLPPLLPPIGPAAADPARALVEEFEDGVRRALARLESVSGAGEPATLFERPPHGTSPADPASGGAPWVAEAGGGGGPAKPDEPPPAKQTSDQPAIPAVPGSAEGPPGPAGATEAARPPQAEIARPPEAARPPKAADAEKAKPPETMDATPPPAAVPDPAERGLVRRVPGAQLPAGARAVRPGAPAPEPAASADTAVREAAAARALVEEFEAGVERALQAGAAPGETSEEGAR